MIDPKQHVLSSSFLKSLGHTITNYECSKNSIFIFIGFDEGDKFFSNDKERKKIKSSISENLKLCVKLIYVELTPVDQVAQYWNMIFFLIRKYAIFDYYYQVNDDLKLITKGWIYFFFAE